MKNKGLLILLSVLLIGNIIWAYLYLANHRPPKRGDNRMREQFVKNVGFSKQQAAAFEKLRNEQHNAAQPAIDSMRLLKKSYIQAILNGTKLDSVNQLFAMEFGKKMIILDYKMYWDLTEARKICTPEQYVKYDSLVKNIILRFSEKKKNK